MASKLSRDLNFHFGSTVQKCRKTNGVLQSQLAKSVGLSVRYLQKIEAGESNLSLSKSEELSSALKIPLESLIGSRFDVELLRVGIYSEGEILDALPIGIQVSDLEGMILYSNRAHLELLGVSRLELTRKPKFIWDFMVNHEEKASLREYLQILVRDQPTPTPFYSKNRRKDGTIVPIKVEWNYLRSSSGELKGFISMIQTHPAW